MATQLANSRNRLKSESGVALMIALVAMVMLMTIAVEVTIDTAADYAGSAQAVNRLKAYYAARGAVELSLLRIKLYRNFAGQAQSSSTPGGGIPLQLLDQIWQIPFMWPFPMPDTISTVEKEQIDKTMKQSFLDAQYTVRIESEGGKLDLNDLGSTSEALRKSTTTQLLKIFQNQVESDDKFAERYRDFDFGKLVNYIADWVSEGNNSANGGDKSSAYPDILDNKFMPPRQPFKSLDELHMVATMTDDLYALLAPRVTVYGTKGINVNYASKETLMSLDPRITDVVIEALNKYKLEVGPFKNKDDFFTFLRSNGVNTKALEANDSLPLYFDAEANFRITADGTFGKASREIVAITYDFDKVKSRLASLLKDEDKAKTPQNPSPAPSPTPAPAPAPAPAAPASNASRGRPTIVYWHED